MIRFADTPSHVNEFVAARLPVPRLQADIDRQRFTEKARIAALRIMPDSTQPTTRYHRTAG